MWWKFGVFFAGFFFCGRSARVGLVVDADGARGVELAGRRERGLGVCVRPRLLADDTAWRFCPAPVCTNTSSRWAIQHPKRFVCLHDGGKDYPRSVVSFAQRPPRGPTR